MLFFEKMKVGILTYHFGTNYGGILQCYALCKSVERLGHSVCVINYCPIANEGNETVASIRSLLRIVRRDGFRKMGFAIMIALMRKKQKQEFDDFRFNYLKMGNLCTSLTDLAGECLRFDALIVGSDQVWAPAHRSSGAYFFNFENIYNGLRIAYAPCCAVKNLGDDKENQLLSSCLRRFSQLSVRNEETQDFVKALTGIKAPIVADPTILESFDTFRHSKKNGKDYILTYILGEDINGGHERVIEQIKNEYGNMPVYAVMPTNSTPRTHDWIDKALFDVSPAEWVDLIARCKFLYTDSFHGVLFALKYHVPFLAYYAEQIRKSRFLSLKKTYALNNIISESRALQSCTLSSLQPCFEEVDSIMSHQVVQSIQYLHNALIK